MPDAPSPPPGLAGAPRPKTLQSAQPPMAQPFPAQMPMAAAHPMPPLHPSPAAGVPIAGAMAPGIVDVSRQTPAPVPYVTPAGGVGVARSTNPSGAISRPVKRKRSAGEIAIALAILAIGILVSIKLASMVVEALR